VVGLRSCLASYTAIIALNYKYATSGVALHVVDWTLAIFNVGIVVCQGSYS
jgi:hypothetical protein